MPDQNPAPFPNVSSVTPAPAPPPLAPRQPPYRMSLFWKLGTIAGAIMVVLALVGVGLTTSRLDSDGALTYWIWLVPIYGVLCIVTAGARGWHEHGLRQLQVFRQVAHWLGIGLALWLDFLIRRAGQETAQAAALNAMLLLALGCYLAGVHLEWHFALVGILLIAAMVVVTKADQYLWVVFLVGAVGIALLLGGRWLVAKWHSRKAPA